MNDPERLIHDGDDLEQALLQAGVGDGPSEASRQKVATALGIGGAHAASWSTAGLLKWIGGVAIVLGLIGGAAQFVRTRRDPTAHEPPKTEIVLPPPAPSPTPPVETEAMGSDSPPIEPP